MIRMRAEKTPWLIQMKKSTDKRFFCPACVVPISRKTVPMRMPKMIVWASCARRTMRARNTFFIDRVKRCHTCENHDGLRRHDVKNKTTKLE